MTFVLYSRSQMDAQAQAEAAQHAQNMANVQAVIAAQGLPVVDTGQPLPVFPPAQQATDLNPGPPQPAPLPAPGAPPLLVPPSYGGYTTDGGQLHPTNTVWDSEHWGGGSS